MSETITQDESDDITIVLLDESDIEHDLNRPPDEFNFVDVKCIYIDKRYAALDEKQPHNANFLLIGIEDLLKVQLHDEFCAKIRRKLNELGCRILKPMTMESLYIIGVRAHVHHYDLAVA